MQLLSKSIITGTITLVLTQFISRTRGALVPHRRVRTTALLVNNSVDTHQQQRNFQSTLLQLSTQNLEMNNDSTKNSVKNSCCHYIFLVHGWLGNSQEMGSLEKSINNYAKNKEVFTKELTKESHVDKDQEHPIQRIITHCATSNDSRTTDGIQNGGSRLAKEVHDFIVNDVKKNYSDDKENTHFTISFVGNSLGGLYARYALSEIKLDQPLEDGITLHPQVFATTATPHLGVASHTFLPLPKTLEYVIGHTLLSTGKDLFRVAKASEDCTDDLIFKMGTDYLTFLEPLSKFKKRIAYANAFSTDFQVPTATAAFLSTKSTYPHSVKINDSDHRDLPFVVARAKTDPNKDILVEEDLNNELPSKEHAMSVKLDALGWEKIFVDVRDFIPLPTLSLPKFVRQNSRSKWQNFLQNDATQLSDGNHDERTVRSKDLVGLMTKSDKLSIPVGHQVMVANSKNDSYSRFTAKGQPVMDYLGKCIVDYLLQEKQ